MTSPEICSSSSTPTAVLAREKAAARCKDQEKTAKNAKTGKTGTILDRFCRTDPWNQRQRFHGHRIHSLPVLKRCLTNMDYHQFLANLPALYHALVPKSVR